MKKIVTIILMVLIVFSLGATALAVEDTKTSEKDNTKVENVVNDEKNADILKMQEHEKTKIEKYKEKYKSDTYGVVAYVLDTLRFFSIPLCFIGIVIGTLYQYILGTRRLDLKHRGFKLIISFVTIFVIFQVLPLAFTVVVLGWRG